MFKVHQSCAVEELLKVGGASPTERLVVNSVSVESDRSSGHGGQSGRDDGRSEQQYSVSCLMHRFLPPSLHALYARKLDTNQLKDADEERKAHLERERTP